METVKFNQISPNEIKFSYKSGKFLLVEGNVGVYGIGRAMRLYQLNGLSKEFIKCVGWTRTDNHGGANKNVLLPGIVTVEQCKTESLEYLKRLLE